MPQCLPPVSRAREKENRKAQQDIISLPSCCLLCRARGEEQGIEETATEVSVVSSHQSLLETFLDTFCFLSVSRARLHPNTRNQAKGMLEVTCVLAVKKRL